MTYPRNDLDFREHTITNVGADGSFTMDDGWSFYCPKESPVQPKVGATARLYGRGIGYTVRGLFIDGERAFYRTAAEDRAEHARREAERKEQAHAAWLATGKAEYERDYATLPDVFQRRLDRFKAGRKGFPEDGGAYEMSCCLDGVKIAAALKTPEVVREFTKKPWDEQMRLVPGLFDGHSGNTFGMACRLAHHYLTDPDLVWREHAAIAALIGCEEAGCLPVRR